MKKVLIVFILLLSISPSFAEEEVYLDLNYPEQFRINTGKLQYENTKTEEDDDYEYLKPSFGQMKDMFKEDFMSKDKD